jgi:capsule biosynthesis phosphatase
MKKLVVDFDNTISVTSGGDYQNSKPVTDLIDLLKKYKEEGFYIAIHSSRNMRTYESNVGKINKHTLPVMIEWLHKHEVPYDEILVGKPWCGFDGFYIDDCSVRPSEFMSMSFEEITSMLTAEKEKIKSLCK